MVICDAKFSTEAEPSLELGNDPGGLSCSVRYLTKCTSDLEL